MAWNHAKLAIKGDVVSVAVNGVEVYRRPIEPTNQRTFGFFHYADVSEARVRQVAFVGAWPRQAPLALGFPFGNNP